MRYNLMQQQLLQIMLVCTKHETHLNTAHFHAAHTVAPREYTDSSDQQPDGKTAQGHGRSHLKERVVVDTRILLEEIVVEDTKLLLEELQVEYKLEEVGVQVWYTPGMVEVDRALQIVENFLVRRSCWEDGRRGLR